MIVICEKCGARYDDQFRWTICPHDTFAANDGQNNFAHHPESALVPPSLLHEPTVVHLTEEDRKRPSPKGTS